MDNTIIVSTILQPTIDQQQRSLERRNDQTMLINLLRQADKMIPIEILEKWKDDYAFFFTSVYRSKYGVTQCSLLVFLIENVSPTQNISKQVDGVIRTHLANMSSEEKEECLKVLLCSNLDDEMVGGLLPSLLISYRPYYHYYNDARVWRRLYAAGHDPTIKDYRGVTFWQQLINDNIGNPLEGDMIAFLGELVENGVMDLEKLINETKVAPVIYQQIVNASWMSSMSREAI